MLKDQTAGELSLEASKDTEKYDPIDIGESLCDDITSNIHECIQKHYHLFDEDEFCIVFVLAKDSVIHNMMRRKFYAWPYLPKPRPNQTCFLFNKKTEKIKRLWVLPKDATMAILSEMLWVNKDYQSMQRWSQSFFKGTFWEDIRNEHQISLLSEEEYFSANRHELIKAGCKDSDVPICETFDFSKIQPDKIIDTKDTKVC